MASFEKHTSTHVFGKCSSSFLFSTTRCAKTQLAFASRTLHPAGQLGSTRASHSLVLSQSTPRLSKRLTSVSAAFDRRLRASLLRPSSSASSASGCGRGGFRGDGTLELERHSPSDLASTTRVTARCLEIFFRPSHRTASITTRSLGDISLYLDSCTWSLCRLKRCRWWPRFRSERVVGTDISTATVDS